MGQNEDDYFRQARDFAAKAAEANEPSAGRIYSNVAADYVRLARYAIERRVDSVLSSQAGELTERQSAA